MPAAQLEKGGRVVFDTPGSNNKVVTPDLKSTPHVLILGAGLGGLLLAQALKKQGISFDIFERDKSLTARSQGYALAIQGMVDDVLRAVPETLPPIDTSSHLYPLTAPPQLNFFFGGKKFVGEATNDPRVLFANRQRLRTWLATNLNIHWNEKAVSIEEAEGHVTVTFSDGSSATGDVVVGADGVGSTVRSHIFKDAAPLQTVPQGVIVGQTTVDKPQLDRLMQLSHSAYSAPGNGFRIFVCLDHISTDAQSASYQWFVIWPDEEISRDPSKCWTATASKRELLDYALKKIESLDKRLTEIFRITDVEGIVQPPLQIRDLVLEAMPNSRITLLGDAAHPMAPFRGRGGQHAMIDAMKLAETLSSSTPEDVVGKLKEYQDEMLSRASRVVQESRIVAPNPSKVVIWGNEVKEVSW